MSDAEACDLLAVLDENARLRERLAALSYAAGQYIECDERHPDVPHLWTAMCEAQQAAAVYLNVGVSGE